MNRNSHQWKRSGGPPFSRTPNSHTHTAGKKLCNFLLCLLLCCWVLWSLSHFIDWIFKFYRTCFSIPFQATYFSGVQRQRSTRPFSDPHDTSKLTQINSNQFSNPQYLSSQPFNMIGIILGGQLHCCDQQRYSEHRIREDDCEETVEA